MEFAILFYIDESTFQGFTEADHQRLQEVCRDEDTELERQGKLLVARALDAPARAVTVSVRQSKLTRTDGPFAETKEHLGGFIIVRAESMEEAVAIAQACELARHGKVEVRPAYDIRAAP
ncbi:MAG: YciI family protein [Rhizobiaceae bacterium]